MLPTCFPHSPPRFPTVGSPIIASVRMKARVIRLLPLEVIQQKTSVAVLPWKTKRSHWKESQASNSPVAGWNPPPLHFKSNIYTTKPVKPQTPCLRSISDLFLLLFYFFFVLKQKSVAEFRWRLCEVVFRRQLGHNGNPYFGWNQKHIVTFAWIPLKSKSIAPVDKSARDQEWKLFFTCEWDVSITFYYCLKGSLYVNSLNLYNLSITVFQFVPERHFYVNRMK